MEDILHNIHNIDNTHVSDFHNELVCERPSVINKSAWEAARALYEQLINEYNKLNWFKKIFTPKPQEPLYTDFMSY